MVKTYLETGAVNHNFETYGYDKVAEELTRQGDNDGVALLKNYPDSFPVLYAIRHRHFDDGASFHFREIPARDREIIPESRDIVSSDKELELQCTLDGAGSFGITVDPYDKAGEDEPQMRARIDFTQKTLDELNAERFKKIMEFCERHGLSVWGMTLPYREGQIDVDEKLAALTRDFLADRKNESIHNPGPTADEETNQNYQQLEPETDLTTAPKTEKKKSAQSEMSLDDMRKEFINYLEKDLHRTRGMTYFEEKKRLDGRKTYVFSLYEKPNPKNMKEDGREDKNGVHVPTYQYRLYVSQDKDGKFHFGFATPGGRKIDDAMAGDLIGLIKKTGATHVNFSNLANAEKGVWLTACAENGLIPIGISINVPKAKKMVDAAKNKLTTEDLTIFKKRLAEQMIKNAAAKCKDKNDATLGLSPSEWGYIESLRAGYDFENFRLAYEDSNGLYAAVIEQIDKGSRDEKEGAATTFGGMQTLRTVFDIYNNYQSKTFGDYLSNTPTVGNMKLTDKERQTLASAIPAGKRMTDLSVQDFRLIYDTLLPRHIENSKKEIIAALEREDNRKGPKRASNVVLSSDIFPKVKGALNEINIILTRNKGLDPLTLPNEHKGLEFLRPDTPKTQQAQQPAQQPAPQPTPQVLNQAQNQAQRN